MRATLLLPLLALSAHAFRLEARDEESDLAESCTGCDEGQYYIFNCNLTEADSTSSSTGLNFEGLNECYCSAGMAANATLCLNCQVGLEFEDIVADGQQYGADVVMKACRDAGHPIPDIIVKGSYADTGSGAGSASSASSSGSSTLHSSTHAGASSSADATAAAAAATGSTASNSAAPGLSSAARWMGSAVAGLVGVAVAVAVL